MGSPLRAPMSLLKDLTSIRRSRLADSLTLPKTDNITTEIESSEPLDPLLGNDGPPYPDLMVSSEKRLEKSCVFHSIYLPTAAFYTSTRYGGLGVHETALAAPMSIFKRASVIKSSTDPIIRCLGNSPTIEKLLNTCVGCLPRNDNGIPLETIAETMDSNYPLFSERMALFSEVLTKLEREQYECEKFSFT